MPRLARLSRPCRGRRRSCSLRVVVAYEKSRFRFFSVPKCRVWSRTYKNTKFSFEHNSLTVRQLGTQCLCSPIAGSRLAVNILLSQVFSFGLLIFFLVRICIGYRPKVKIFSYYYLRILHWVLLAVCRTADGAAATACCC